MKYRWSLFLTFSIVLSACAAPFSTQPLVDSPLTDTVTQETPRSSAAESYGIITLPISIYILDDEAGTLSSQRTIEEFGSVYEKANEIWGQAGIAIEVQNIQRLTLPSQVIQSIALGEFGDFFNTVGRDYPLPTPSILNGFYPREIGGPNGIHPAFTRVFFVTDAPSVYDEHVTSHEIGHILGLHHNLNDPERLLYPGTNGMNLTDEEITIARYVAQGLLDGVR